MFVKICEIGKYKNLFNIVGSKNERSSILNTIMELNSLQDNVGLLHSLIWKLLKTQLGLHHKIKNKVYEGGLHQGQFGLYITFYDFDSDSDSV